MNLSILQCLDPEEDTGCSLPPATWLSYVSLKCLYVRRVLRPGPIKKKIVRDTASRQSEPRLTATFLISAYVSIVLKLWSSRIFLWRVEVSTPYMTGSTGEIDFVS